MRYVLLTEQGCERRIGDASVRFEVGALLAHKLRHCSELALSRVGPGSDEGAGLSAAAARTACS